MFYLLNKLPLKWQQKLKTDKFRVWEIHFTLDSDSQKDWLWELLFWDAKRRKMVFASLIVVLLLCITLFLLLAFGECDKSDSSEPMVFAAIVKSAYDGDSQAQFLLGKNFYFGESVKRDVDQALLWLTKSARAGHTQAAELLQKILVEQQAIRVHDGQYIWKKNDNSKTENRECDVTLLKYNVKNTKVKQEKSPIEYSSLQITDCVWNQLRCCFGEIMK